MFTEFEMFLNGQTVFRLVSKRMRNTLKQCSKSGQPGVTRKGSPGRGHQEGSARGHQGFSQGSPGGQPRVTRGSARDQPGVR